MTLNISLGSGKELDCFYSRIYFSSIGNRASDSFIQFNLHMWISFLVQ